MRFMLQLLTCINQILKTKFYRLQSQINNSNMEIKEK
jgi:hypothetical protein